MLIEMREMTDNGQGQDNGLLIVEKIESLLNIGVQSLGVSKSKTARLSKLMKGKFDVYWLNKLTKLKWMQVMIKITINCGFTENLKEALPVNHMLIM